MKKLKLISGTANQELAKEVSSKLKIPLTPITISRFNDGEIYVKVEESVRGCDIFVIQPTCPQTNETLMELLIIVDALKRASAREITAVVPYYGYARQDRKATPREPISAKLMANLLTTAGVNRVVTFDLHVDQLQGFFDIPLDNLEVMPLLADCMLDKNLKNPVVVSPDAGGTVRARRLAKLIGASLAIIDKRRPKHGVAKVINIIGEVKDKTAILIDDMIDTAGTITKAAQAIKDAGALDIYVCATHPVFSGPAIERLEEAPLKDVVVTNTINIPEDRKLDKIKVISLAPLLAETINRIFEGKPMGVVFDEFYDNLRKKLGNKNESN
ncbi:MAG: ribose-phosphate pyrophosphokinase [Candidatus Omnitrophota bacterium]|nr:MAG: ribose-phosphate pyrophosphokinase [Candidatus Omnitrophota bacterium]